MRFLRQAQDRLLANRERYPALPTPAIKNPITGDPGFAMKPRRMGHPDLGMPPNHADLSGDLWQYG